MAKPFTPWSTLGSLLGKPDPNWPVDEAERIASYEKYDQMYWNDPTQYALRTLDGEEPIYVPNARVIVDTTAHYLLKGLTLTAKGKAKKDFEDFLKRERFYSKFHVEKLAGITRGDWAYHITADPSKEPNKRISIEPIHPGMVWMVRDDDDDPERVTRINIFEEFEEEVKANGIDQTKTRIRKLTYERLKIDGKWRIGREEAIWEITPSWLGPDAKKVLQTLDPELLPEDIDQFPIYWFKNIEWSGQDYGSSELRGLEWLEWAVSQTATDLQGSVSLEGLGVYATDGGRPVDDQGNERDWEIAPGMVAEVPSGAYFRRVQGLGSITPVTDHIDYLEKKMYSASGMTDVALGQIDVQTAQSGIALAIKFMPTLAKIENRDVASVEVLQQMFYDLGAWYRAYEDNELGDIEVSIDKTKLPANRTETINELNNMLDRKIISRRYYADRMVELGYSIDFDEMKKEIEKEDSTSSSSTESDPEAGSPPITTADGGNNQTVDTTPNQSNNQSRPNESAGTEATQTPAQQSKTQ